MDAVHRSVLLSQRKFAVVLIVAWTIIVIVSFLWTFHNTRQNILEKARTEAGTLYELNLAYREWSAFHGGVYVPITGLLQPNPYLHVPDRDVTTTKGKRLTLVNPAWMTRQVFELFSAKSMSQPIINHLTSLKYVNPRNKPDAWEEAGLRSFEQGAGEVSESVVINNQPYLRIMKPFVTQEGCLKCHAHQGYKTGDIRGGMSIAVPLRQLLAAGHSERMNELATHVLLWFFGLAGIMVFSWNMRRKQDQLAQSEEKYRLLFANNPHPMWVYDLDTLAFLTVNDSAVELYGYSRDEFLSMTIKDIRLPEEVPALIKHLSTIPEGTDHAGHWRHRKKDGSIIFVEITTHALDFGGKRAKLVMATDITEHRKLEDQFRHAQKMEAVGRLAGGVAHDFNNILTAIIGYGSLTQMKMKDDDPLRHNVEQIIAASQRGANLTQGLLAFSRKQIINPRPVNINDIIERVSKLLTRLIGEDVKLETKLTGEDLVVVADSGQLEQVLMNLATNARDAMQQGGTLNIESSRAVLDERFIRAHNYGRPGIYALIALTDSGTGMDAKTAERIFEPFFTTKETGRGTGLGLSMVYGTVKQHNGYINVYTEVGKGTTFKIYLPLVAAAAEEHKPERHATLKGGSETILVAEDDASLRRLVKSVLEEFGYTVIEAIDGEDAVEKIGRNREKIQLLLLDVIMPNKNGREVYEEAKKLMPSIKTLFVSGYTADIVHKKGILAEGQDFISKPVSPNDLLKKIREVLDK